MKKYLILLPLFINIVFSQTYCAGEQISINHQMQEFDVCYGSGEYNTGDSWKLADFNGALNGGDYHIIFIDMSATW